MTTILRKLPFFDKPTTAAVRGEQVRVKPYQVIFWVSISKQDLLEWDPRMPRFPAILDTGHSHNFSIQQRHLLQWAGMQNNYLDVLGSLREGQRIAPLHAATLWIHRNLPHRRDEASDQPPFRMELRRGIAVYPDDGSSFPRLPLLGFRAIVENQIHLTVDGRKQRVSLRTARRWPFSFLRS